jgi:hypothetical protein
MAALVWVTTNLRVVLAAHVAHQFMDGRSLRSPHDVQRHGLVGVAAEASNFEVAVARIEGVAKRRRGLGRSVIACAGSRPRRRADQLPCAPPSHAPLMRGSSCRRSTLVTLYPLARGCPRSVINEQAATPCGLRGVRAQRDGLVSFYASWQRLRY